MTNRPFNNPPCLVACVGLALVALAVQAFARTWTDASGRYHTEGEMVGAAGQKIWIDLSGDDLFLVPLSEFSRPDQEYARAQLPRFRAAVAPAPSEAIRYQAGRQVGTLANADVDESSGIACSRRHPGVFWTHNDSGAQPRLYAFDSTGRDLGSMDLAGETAFDWEDMASVVLDGKSYLIIGDIGNNGLNSAVQMIYVVQEPDVDPRRGGGTRQVPVTQVINFSYSDDVRNCEALAIDPTTKTFYLASKEKRLSCWIYALPWPENDPKKCFVARPIARLPLPKVTGMDISPDGRRALLVTYGDAYQYVRRAEETWAEAFQRPGTLVELPEREQGESICYGPDGKTLWLTSEKRPTPLVRVDPQPASP